MDTHVNYTVVGAFVITLLIAIVLAIIWLSSGLTLHEKSNYLVYSQESVSGLSMDAPVEYNGVKVGTVKGISIVRNNPRLVRVLLSINNQTPVTKGTVATLTSRGITGVAFIALKDEGKDLTPLVATKGYPYPVIRSGPSLFLRLDFALQKLTSSLETVARSVNRLLDKQNLRSFKRILLNLDRASAQFTPLLLRGSRTLQTIDTQTLPVAYKMLSNANELMRNLKEVSRDVKQNPAVLIRGTSPPPLGPGEEEWK